MEKAPINQDEPQTNGGAAQPGQRNGPSPNGARPPGRVRPDLVEESVVEGTHPGDRYLHYKRRIGPFKHVGRGRLSASLETGMPRTRTGHVFNRIKQVLIGTPISNEHSIHERLTRAKGLAVLASDPLSSVAYATEEVLRVLVIAGAGVVAGLTLPIGLAIMALLAVVAISYRQTIAAYPRGGGSYIVAKDNLGTMPGLVAAASILIDYTMTVAVSVSAGVAALYSLAPSLLEYRVEICLAIIVVIAIANLRGVREAGNIFAAPTYIFIVGMVGLVGYGVVRVLTGDLGPANYIPPEEVIPFGSEQLVGLAGVMLVLRAFTQGCTALTGVEAIADGVPAFKPPESHNARITLAWMAGLAISMFGGTTFLAWQLGVQPSEQETVLSQIARSVLPSIGDVHVLHFYIQVATALILVLAANTAFADFPRLSYFLARDKFMPHQYAFRGDRLAFSWGIITLAIVASVLIIAFNGVTTALIPLYTVGVFNSFTLSQAGMVVRWWKTRTTGWKRNLVINGLGMTVTGVVLVISAATKFEHGAWIVLVLIPVLIAMFLAINRHYRHVQQEVAALPATIPSYKHTFVVPVSQLTPFALNALSYARSLSSNVTAVHVAEGEDPTEAEHFLQEWDRVLPGTDVDLVLIESPYRSLIGPLLSYIDALDRRDPHDTITVVVAEVLPAKPWEYLLHNQSALRLKTSLLFRPNTAVIDLPHQLRRDSSAAQTRAGAIFSQIPWIPILVLLGALSLAYYFLF